MPVVVRRRFDRFRVEFRASERKERGFSGNGEQGFGGWSFGVGSGGGDWGVDSEAAVEEGM